MNIEIAIAIVSVLVFSFFFTEPRFTLHAYDASYPMTFLVILIASFITSTLAGRIKAQAAQKAYHTEELLQTSQKRQKVEEADAIVLETAGQMVKLLAAPYCSTLSAQTTVWGRRRCISRVNPSQPKPT